MHYFGSDTAFCSLIPVSVQPTILSDWLQVTSNSLSALNNLILQSN